MQNANVFVEGSNPMLSHECRLHIDEKSYLSISQRILCPLDMWAFVLDGNLFKSC